MAEQVRILCEFRKRRNDRTKRLGLNASSDGRGTGHHQVVVWLLAPVTYGATSRAWLRCTFVCRLGVKVLWSRTGRTSEATPY